MNCIDNVHYIKGETLCTQSTTEIDTMYIAKMSEELYNAQCKRNIITIIIEYIKAFIKSFK